MMLLIVLCFFLVKLECTGWSVRIRPTKVSWWIIRVSYRKSIPLLRNMVTLLRIIQRLLGCLIDDLEKYWINVDVYREDVARPFLLEWMMETLIPEEGNGDVDSSEQMAMKAVHHTITVVGHRERNPINEEAMARMIRKTLLEYGMTESAIPYWSELGLNMYFNPPYSTKAVCGKFEGFQ